MDDAAFVGGHGFDGDLPARAHRFVRQLLREAFERLFALVAVAFAVDDEAFILFPADVGDGAGDHLQRVEHLAAVPRKDVGVGGDHVDAGVLLVFFQLGGRRNAQKPEHPFEEVDGSLAVGAFSSHAHARLHALCEQSSLFPLFEYGNFCLLAREAHRFQALFDRLFHRFPGELILCHFFFPPLRSSGFFTDCGILLLYFSCISRSSIFLNLRSIKKFVVTVLNIPKTLLVTMYILNPAL